MDGGLNRLRGSTHCCDSIIISSLNGTGCDPTILQDERRVLLEI